MYRSSICYIMQQMRIVFIFPQLHYDTSSVSQGACWVNNKQHTLVNYAQSAFLDSKKKQKQQQQKTSVVFTCYRWNV